MTNPIRCPKCQAPLPESLEQFGANFACRACGQILQYASSEPLDQRQTQKQLSSNDDDDDGDDDDLLPIPLPPIDRLLSEGWELFKDRMGICIGVFALATLLNLVAQIPELYVNFFVKQRPMAPQTQALLSVGMLIVTFIRVAFSVWLNIGLHQFALRIVRGQSAEVGDLFEGGRYFWRALLCLIVTGLAVLAGTLLCIVPGIIVALIYWPVLFVLVDRDLPGLESLQQSSKTMSGNKTALFGLLLVTFLINIMGILALGVGMLFAVPYTFLVSALAYDRISGLSRRRPSRDDDDENEAE